MATSSRGKSDKARFRFYGGVDPRELPAYRIAEAAYYLGMPVTTLRSWVQGQAYQHKNRFRRFEPIIEPPEVDRPGQPLRLSFFNLVEAHVLYAIRKKYNMSLDLARRTIECLHRRFPDHQHPLATVRLETNGVSLFAEVFGEVVDVGRDGQQFIPEAVMKYLIRIERDVRGVPIRIFPFTSPTEGEDDRPISIDPFVAFGNPVIAGTRIKTAVIIERFLAGETPEFLAKDYGLSQNQVLEAIRYEAKTKAA